jgi:hypothetical protein
MPTCNLCGQPAVLVWLRFTDGTYTDVQNVFACAAHQLGTVVACLTHLPTCTAPNVVNLPACDCQPVNTAVQG